MAIANCLEEELEKSRVVPNIFEPYGDRQLKEMSKIDKKRKKLQDRIDFLNEELRISLTKKTSSTREVSLPEHQKKIQELQTKLNNL